MPKQSDDRTDKPSIVDIVTHPEKFDTWQRHREREEGKDRQRKDSLDRPSE
jgi:hypothetical protein